MWISVIRRVCVVAVLCTACVTGAAAQDLGGGWPQDPQGPPPQNQRQMPNGQARQMGPNQQQPGGGQISPADVQAMFDAMALNEAEKFLALTTEQFPVFVQKLRRLQDARVVQARKRGRLTNELRRLVNPMPQGNRVDEIAIAAKLKELDQTEAESMAMSKKAFDELEQGLSPRQRARFRLLEENLERKKVEFLSKVRQPGGPGDFNRH